MQQITPTEEYYQLNKFVSHSFTFQAPATPQSTPLQNRDSQHRFISKQSSLVDQVSTLLSALTSKFSNQKINNSKLSLTPFLNEIFKRSKCSKNIILLSAYYFHKLYTFKMQSVTNLPEFSRCSKRIYLVCLILSHKFLKDQTFSMKSWQRISGLPTKDIATMERWCLGKLDYELFLEESALQEWAKDVLSKDTVSSDSSVSAISCDTASKKRARQEEDEYELYRPKRLGQCIN